MADHFGDVTKASADRLQKGIRNAQKGLAARIVGALTYPARRIGLLGAVTAVDAEPPSVAAPVVRQQSSEFARRPRRGLVDGVLGEIAAFFTNVA